MTAGPEPSETLLLTGIPRGGTTLVCHLLNLLPDVVALSEPMNVMEFSGLNQTEVFTLINRFSRENRRTILEHGTAISKQVNGRLPDNPCLPGLNDLGLRKSILSLGEIRIGKKLTEDFTLAIKHNAAFTALIDRLVNGYRCFGIVRNPLAVLTSWSTVDFAVHSGRTPVGEALDRNLRNELEAIGDLLDRQLHLLNWFFKRISETLPRDRIIKYEELISSGGKCLSSITPTALNLNEKLKDQAKFGLLNQEKLKMIGQRLLSNEGAYLRFYSRDEIIRELDRITNTSSITQVYKDED
jgi:hypothetical protein